MLLVNSLFKRLETILYLVFRFVFYIPFIVNISYYFLRSHLFHIVKHHRPRRDLAQW